MKAGRYKEGIRQNFNYSHFGKPHLAANAPFDLKKALTSYLSAKRGLQSDGFYGTMGV